MREFKEMQLGTFTQGNTALLTRTVGIALRCAAMAEAILAVACRAPSREMAALRRPLRARCRRRLTSGAPGRGTWQRWAPEEAARAGEAGMAAAGPAFLLHVRL